MPGFRQSYSDGEGNRIFAELERELGAQERLTRDGYYGDRSTEGRRTRMRETLGKYKQEIEKAGFEIKPEAVYKLQRRFDF